MAPRANSECKFCGALLESYPALIEPEVASAVPPSTPPPGGVPRPDTTGGEHEPGTGHDPGADAEPQTGGGAPPRPGRASPWARPDPSRPPADPVPSVAGDGTDPPPSRHRASGAPAPGPPAPGTGSGAGSGAGTVRPDAPSSRGAASAASGPSEPRAWSSEADGGSARRPPSPTEEPPSFAQPRVAGTPIDPATRSGRTKTRVWLAVPLLIAVLALSVVAMSRTGVTSLGKQGEALAGKGEWVTYTDPDGVYSVQLPVTPKVESTTTSFGAPWRRITAKAGASEFTVETIDFDRGVGGVYAENYLDQEPSYFAQGVGGRLTYQNRTSLLGHPAVEFAIDADGGWRWRATEALFGGRLYVFSVSARSDAPEGLERLVQSFQPLAPKG